MLAKGAALAVLILAAASAAAQTSAPASAPGNAPGNAPPGAAACSGCHGGPDNPAMPTLQGRSARYLALTMEAFRTGDRAATVMDRIAKGFSEEETQAIAAWLAAQR